MQRNLLGLQLADSSHVLLSSLNTVQQAVIRKVAVLEFPQCQETKYQAISSLFRCSTQIAAIYCFQL